MRIEKGEVDGEFDGNSKDFDDGFGGFDVFQYACGAMNPSTGARRGRVHVSCYKSKRRNRAALAPGPGAVLSVTEGFGSGLVWFLPRPQASPRSSTHPPVIQPGASRILPSCHLISPSYHSIFTEVPQPQERSLGHHVQRLFSPETEFQVSFRPP